MADKQEIKYRVRKIDGTYGADGTISLNAIKDGGRYLVHRALVAQSNKKDKEQLLRKLEVKYAEEEKNRGSKRYW